MKKFHILILAIMALLVSGCTMFPQKRVMISSHNQDKADMYNLSYPATLRAASIFLGLDPAIDAGVLKEINDLKASLEEDKKKLQTLGSEDSEEKNRLYKEIADTQKKIRTLSQGWVRPRILAEPPPDVAETLKLSLKLDKAAKKGEIDLNSALQQIRLATESDVKRHLAYRLNEAFFNEPELIGKHYKSIMESIVNLKVTDNTPPESPPSPPSGTPDKPDDAPDGGDGS